jgi:hypothetical protein
MLQRMLRNPRLVAQPAGAAAQQPEARDLQQQVLQRMLRNPRLVAHPAGAAAQQPEARDLQQQGTFLKRENQNARTVHAPVD